jgi:hypothetical protein|tara:strand:- start:466 stop:1125 length:660 start_codon:yes stop_codon:yes gene_type:complete
MINEINSLKKTIKILNPIKCKKEYLIIVSKKLTSKKILIELKKIKKKYSNFFIFFQSKKFIGGAIIKGIQKSKNNHIAIMAADMETNPSDLKKMVSISKLNLNSIISGDRWFYKDSFKKYNYLKLIANYIAQKVIKLIYKTTIKDFTFAYRIYPRKILSKFEISELRQGFALETILKPIKLGYKVINFPTKWKARTEGAPTSSIFTYYSFLKVLIKNIF